MLTDPHRPSDLPLAPVAAFKQRRWFGVSALIVLTLLFVLGVWLLKEHAPALNFDVPVIFH